MLNKSILLSTIFIFSFITIACDNDNSDAPFDFPETIRALSENDFINDENAFAVPEDGVVVTLLEHPEADHENDTGEQGVDIIPIKYISDTNHTYCWEDGNDEASHFMTLNDLEGNEVLMVFVNEGCVTEFVESGEYEIHVHHDGNSEEIFPIFLRPDNEVNEEIVQVTLTQNEIQNFNTLLSTNSCQGCDLQNLTIGTFSFTPDGTPVPRQPFNFSNANLRGADLTNADLSGGIFTGADFTSAILLNINDDGTDFTNAIFSLAIWKNGNACNNSSTSGVCNQAKFTFLASMPISSNILTVAQSMFSNCTTVSNGLDAADCICSTHAENAGIGSNYRAWLADNSGSPVTRFTQSSIPYIRTDGAIVANNWDDLTDGGIASPINLDENENLIGNMNLLDIVWTNVTTSGTVDSNGTCNNWTAEEVADRTLFGGNGVFSRTDSFWTQQAGTVCIGPDNDGDFGSDAIPYLYCFMQ